MIFFPVSSLGWRSVDTRGACVSAEHHFGERRAHNFDLELSRRGSFISGRRWMIKADARSHHRSYRRVHVARLLADLLIAWVRPLAV